MRHLSKYFVILFIIIIFQIVVNYLFIVKKTSPCAWDFDEVHQYYHDAKIYYEAIKNGRLFGGFRSLSIRRIRPPLLMLSAVPFVAINNSARFVLWTNSLYIIILLVAIYLIAARIESRNAGIIAVILCSSFPILIVLSRAFMPAYALTAIFALSILFLLLSEGFKSPTYSVGFGLLTGIGMLCKWTFFIFLIGPVVYFLVKSKKEGQRFHICLRNFTISLIVGLVICFPWYANFWRETIGFLFDVSWGRQSLFSRPNIIYGPGGIFAQIFILNDEQIGSIFMLVFMVSIFLLIRSQNKNKWWLIIAFAAPYLFFALIRNKHIRLTAPILAIISLIIAVGVCNIHRDWLRRASFSLIFFIGIFNFYSYTFPNIYLENVWPLTPLRFDKVGPFTVKKTDIKSGNPVVSTVSLGRVKLFSYDLHRSWRTRIKEDWRVKELVDEIDRTRNRDKPTSIIVVPDLEPIWTGIFDMLQVRKLPLSVDVIPRETALIQKADYTRILEYDFVVVKKRWLRPDYYGPDSEPAFELLRKHKTEFELLKRFRVLDGDTVLLYKRL